MEGIWLAEPSTPQCPRSSQPPFRDAKKLLGPQMPAACFSVTQQQNLSSAESEHPWALWGRAVPFLMSCAFGSSLSLCGPRIWSSTRFLTEDDCMCCCGCLASPSTLYCSCQGSMYVRWYSCVCAWVIQRQSDTQDIFPAVIHSKVFFFPLV